MPLTKEKLCVDGVERNDFKIIIKRFARMKTIFFKFFMLLYKLGLFLSPVLAVASVLLFVFSLGLFSSCSKESFSDDKAIDGGTKGKAVVWDNTAYNVSYLMDIPVVSSSPSNDKDFYIDLALEDSENPNKVLSLSCKNYLYGEKVDLTTNKYSTEIQIKDGQLSSSIDGGSSRVKAGSYYKLTRKGNRIDLIIDLVYSGGNGYEHNLKVNYAGEMPREDYLPTENWQNVPFAHYSFTYDEAQYDYWSFVDFPSTPFSCKVINERSHGVLNVWADNFKYNEKVDLSKKEYGCLIRLNLSNEVEDSKEEKQEEHEWFGDAILEGSYLYIKQDDTWKCEAVLDAKCKDKDGTVHHIQAEYNVYK